MIPEIARLRAEVKEAETKFKSKQAELNALLNNHKHIWSAYKYNPRRKPNTDVYIGYYYGRYDTPMYARADEMIPRWVRHCEICGKAQETEKTKATTRMEEDVRVTREEPDFNG